MKNTKLILTLTTILSLSACGNPAMLSVEEAAITAVGRNECQVEGTLKYDQSKREWVLADGSTNVMSAYGVPDHARIYWRCDFAPSKVKGFKLTASQAYVDAGLKFETVVSEYLTNIQVNFDNSVDINDAGLADASISFKGVVTR